jgi:sugar O-acyltransferase (sialic acid O-acetyltransferase NeuD family)
MKKIIIFGAGRASRDILQLIEQINKTTITWKVLAFVDPDPQLKNQIVDGVPVFETITPELAKQASYGITGVQIPNIREKIIGAEIEANLLKLATLIHPAIDVPDDAHIADGCVLFPGVFVAKNVTLGKAVLVNYNTLLGIDLTVGKYSFIGPAVTITASCSIGENCTIGAGSLFVPGVSVGNNCMIGLGTKLITSIEDSQNVFDLPRKFSREMDHRPQRVSW